VASPALTSTHYEWVGKYQTYDHEERLSVATGNLFRARMRLISYAIEEVTFLSQTAHLSKLSDTGILLIQNKWCEMIISILTNKDTWVFDDPHGATWRCFQEQSDGTRRMIVS